MKKKKNDTKIAEKTKMMTKSEVGDDENDFDEDHNDGKDDKNVENDDNNVDKDGNKIHYDYSNNDKNDNRDYSIWKRRLGRNESNHN